MTIFAGRRVPFLLLTRGHTPRAPSSNAILNFIPILPLTPGDTTWARLSIATRGLLHIRRASAMTRTERMPNA